MMLFQLRISHLTNPYCYDIGGAHCNPDWSLVRSSAPAWRLGLFWVERPFAVRLCLISLLYRCSVAVSPLSSAAVFRAKTVCIQSLGVFGFVFSVVSAAVSLSIVPGSPHRRHHVFGAAADAAEAARGYRTSTIVACPGGAERMVASSFGTNSLRSASLFVGARRTTTAILSPLRFCWDERFRSTVTNTSNCCDASVSSSPFSIEVQPIWRAVAVSCPARSRERRQSTHSSRKILTRPFQRAGLLRLPETR